MDDGAVAGSNIDVVSVDLQVGDEDFQMIRRSIVIASGMAICIYIYNPSIGKHGIDELHK